MKTKRKITRITLFIIPGILIIAAIYAYFSFAWMFFVKPGDGGKNFQGPISSIAGSDSGLNGFSDGTGIGVRMDKPIRLAVLNDSSIVFADINNHAVRILYQDGTVKTIAGGPGKKGYLDGNATEAKLNSPHGVAVRYDGAIAVAEAGNNVIRLLTPDTFQIDGEINYKVTTLAGIVGQKGMKDGINNEALFSAPHSVVWGPEGELYLADIGNSRIRKIQNGITSTVAGRDETGEGDGPIEAGTLKYPMDITLDNCGNLWIIDAGTLTIRKWNIEEGLTTPFKNLKIAMPHGITVIPNKYIAIAELYGHRILLYDIADGKVSTLCGTTEKGFNNGRLNKPAAVIFHNNKLWIADMSNHRIVYAPIPD
jgi:hypothetical protein